MNATAKYGLLQGGYWMLYCIGYGYVTFYLLGCGYAAGEIGMIAAAFGTLAAFLQPLLGRLADHGGRWGWKPILTAQALLALMLTMGLLLLGPVGSPAVGLVFGSLLMTISTMLPLVNAASFYYNNRGIRVDFGIGRGMGSLIFAALSLVLGRVAAAAGVRGISVASVAVSLFFLVITLSMSYEPTAVAAPSTAASAKAGLPRQKGSVLQFFRRYPAFTRMLAASVLLLAFHNITNTYLLQMFQHVGGDSANMGVSMAIAALAELPVMFGFSRIIRRFPAAGLLVVSGFSFVAKGILFLLATNVFMIYGAQLLQMFSFALFASASVYYAEQTMDPADKVTGQACMTCTITAGAVIGNLSGGWVLELCGLPPTLWLGLALAVAGALISVSAYNKQQKSTSATP